MRSPDFLSNTVARFVATVVRHPRAAVAVGLTIMGISAWFAMRLTLEPDVRSLIAGTDVQINQQLAALSQFSALDHLLIQIDAQNDPHGLESAAREAHRVLSESGAFKSVRFEISLEQQQRLAEVLLPRRFLLDPIGPATLFAEQHLTERLHTVRESILAPQGIMEKTLRLQDPLGSLGRGLAGLQKAPGLSKMDASSGKFLAADGDSLLMFAVPHGGAFAADAAKRSMEALARAQEHISQHHPNITVRAIGGHRFASDAEQMIRKDVHTSAALTLAVILVLFIAFFRKPHLALAAFPPLLFGATIAAGVAGLFGTSVHGIVLAFAAACLGLSIDYTIHLVSATAYASSTDPSEAVIAASRRVGGSLALAAASTVVALFVLSLAQASAVQQMAYLAMSAVTGAFFGNLLWVPIILPWLSRHGAQPNIVGGPWIRIVRLSRAKPVAILILATGFALFSAFSVHNVAFDGDLRNLDTHTAAAVADEERFVESFGDPGASNLAVVSAPTLDAALQTAHALEEALRALGVERFLSPTLVAPPSSILDARRHRWCSLDRAAFDKFDAVAHTVGFARQAFAPFHKDLENMCAAADSSVSAAPPVIDALESFLERKLVAVEHDSVKVAVAFQLPDSVAHAQVEEIIAEQNDVVWVSQKALNERLVTLIASDLPKLAGLALLLVAVLLGVRYRNFVAPLRALAPCALGMLGTLGLLAFLDIPINLMNLCTFPLLAGLGIDYGILMTDADGTDASYAERAFSVTLAAATTLAGFGSLAVAEYAAISTIGKAVLLAVCLSAVLALMIPPALASLKRGVR